MIKPTMEKSLNDHINSELYSSYLYLSMSSYFQSINLPGFAHWMLVQYKEETTHAMKFFNYLNDRGGRIILEAIARPETGWESPVAALETSLEHEKTTTERINSLVDSALAERDHATVNFLQWFVSEQVEEEATFVDVIEQLRRIGDSKSALYFLDKELGQRQFVDETQQNG